MNIYIAPFCGNILHGCADSTPIEKKLTTFEYYGYNTGNIIWYSCVKRSIHYDCIKWWQGESAICEDDRDSTIVIPSTVALWVAYDWLPLMQKVESYNLKTVMMGLGIHLSREIDTPAKLIKALPLSTIRAVKIIADHSVSIGVRGAMTAECLDMLGIHNYRIIGCPSFYAAPHTIRHICASKHDYDIRVINLCINGSSGALNVPLLNELYKLQLLHRSFLVMQSMNEMPLTRYANKPIYTRHMQRYFPGAAYSMLEWTEYLRKRSKIFFDYDEWITFFKKNSVDFSIGGRFHGNMAALLAGIPALWLTNACSHVELCEAMSLPYVQLSDAEKYINIMEIMEKTKYLYNDSFYQNYLRLQKNYIDFLHENGLLYVADMIDSE